MVRDNYWSYLKHPQASGHRGLDSMKRVKIGDVVEIATRKGLSYAHYTHKHDQPPRFGALLRVFGEHHASRPDRFDDIVSNRPAFLTFFPLGAAVKRGIFPVVANVPVPPNVQPFPTFRCAGLEDPMTGKVGVWWLWDGEKEWRVGELTKEQRSLSIRGICNDTSLMERIEVGWIPETDPR